MSTHIYEEVHQKCIWDMLQFMFFKYSVGVLEYSHYKSGAPSVMYQAETEGMKIKLFM